MGDTGHPPDAPGRSARVEPAPSSDRQAVAVLDFELGVEECALLQQAAELTGTSDPRSLVRVALSELVERRRFQNWVKSFEGSPSGRA